MKKINSKPDSSGSSDNVVDLSKLFHQKSKTLIVHDFQLERIISNIVTNRRHDFEKTFTFRMWNCWSFWNWNRSIEKVVIGEESEGVKEKN